MQNYLLRFETALDSALRAGNYKQAKLYQELRDWQAYNKDIDLTKLLIDTDV